MVSEVPLDSSATFCATRVENKGESAITTNPQNSKKLTSNGTEWPSKKNGESKQHKQDSANAIAAIRFAPKRCDNIPLTAHAMAPQAIITKDKSEIFISLWV